MMADGQFYWNHVTVIEEFYANQMGLLLQHRNEVDSIDLDLVRLFAAKCRAYGGLPPLPHDFNTLVL
jgi:hypothetical protein